MQEMEEEYKKKSSQHLIENTSKASIRPIAWESREISRTQFGRSVRVVQNVSDRARNTKNKMSAGGPGRRGEDATGFQAKPSQRARPESSTAPEFHQSPAASLTEDFYFLYFRLIIMSLRS